MWVVLWPAVVALKELLLQKENKRLSKKPGQNGVRPKWPEPRKRMSPTEKRQKGAEKNPETEGGEFKEHVGTTKTIKPRSPSPSKTKNSPGLKRTGLKF